MWPRARNSMLNKWIGIAASIALVGLSGQLPAAAEDELPAGHYIVALPDAPVALHPSTKAAVGESVDVTSAAAVSRADALQRAQDRVLADVEAQPTSRYTTVLNGFAVELTAAEATELAARSDVISLTPDTPRPLHTGESATSGRAAPTTDTTPDELGLRGPGGAWMQLGGSAYAGTGQVIGVIDSGIDWENPSFSAEGMPNAPDGFNGSCEVVEDPDAWPESACTGKIVAGRYFAEGPAAYGEDIADRDSLSPLDTDGHGSHVSGIAAGREYDYNGIEGHFGIAGVAPMAHLAAYKACWDIPRYSQVLCYPRDSIAALEAAVADGVDVVNFSVGGSTDTYRDAVDLAFQNAAAAGIFVATSVGNRATASDALSHPVPWMTTVAATRYRTDGGPSATVAPSSSRGPANVPTRQQTILKPDIGAPGVDVFSALSRGANGEPDWYYKSGTSMASPHIAGLAALQLQLHPRWSPMAVKSSMMTTANRYANEKSNAPFAGGAGAILPARMFAPGLVLESRQRDWTKFLQTPSRGYTLNAPSLQIPQLPGDAPLQVVRTLTNVSEGPLTYTADFTGPSTLGATVTPRRFTVGPGASIDVTISVRNRGLGVADWQHGWLRWSAADQNDVTIPVVARGAVTQAEVTAQRWAGANRYETAAAVSTKFTEEVDTVYLSSGTHFADALSASPIAAKGMVPDLDRPPGNPAPILLANNGLPRATVAALDQLQPSRIVILGGKKAIPASVEQDLMTQGYAVTRVGGANRYETSARLASAYRPGVPVVYVASGDDAAFPDALSGASLAALKGGPILLTRSDSVPSAVAEALRDLEPVRVVVLGGTSRVSAAVYAELGADERIAGKNRYDTSAKIARRFATPAESVFVANGRTWPDALAGSVVAGSQGSPVVITEGNALSGPTREALTNLAAANIVVLGGTVAVSPAVEAAARAASR